MPLVLQAAVLAAHEVAADPRLEHGDDLPEALVADVLQLSEHAGAEEHLRGTQAELVRLELQHLYDALRHLPPVHEARRDRVRRQDRIAAYE